MDRIVEYDKVNNEEWRLESQEVNFRAQMHSKCKKCITTYSDVSPENRDYLFYMEGATEAYRALTKWNAIEKDESGFATDDALDEIFANLPVLVKGKGEMSLITDEDAYEWRGDLERQPRQYLWRKVENI